MAEPQTAGHIETLIEGGVSGQVVVGNNNVQVLADHGAVVYVLPPEECPKPRPRPSPVQLLPRPFRGLLDRKEPADDAASALREGLPVEICGPPGIGKSALLRHLAHTLSPESCPHGFVYLDARKQPASDLLQALFEAFYESDVPFKPTDVQLRHFLKGRRALVLLDDLELDHQETEDLLNAAPACTFLLISQERCLWGEGRSLILGGLPPEDALALYERGLERPLSPEEKSAAVELCARLEGNPLRILQAAARTRDGKPPIAFPDEETRILSVLAAVGGGPAGATHLSSLADVPDLVTRIRDLLRRRLVKAHSPRYSLTGDLAGELAGVWNLEPWRERALTYFTVWAEENRSNPAAVLQEALILRRLLDWAIEHRHWEAALQLGRATEGALLLSGGWSAWAETLESVRQAAQALEDRVSEGWSLHQLGTRLLCLDDKPGARGLLTRALEIRESLGDRDGAAVTRHNLGLLGVPVPSSGKPGRENLRLLSWTIPPLLVLAGAAAWYARTAKTENQTSVPTPTVESPAPPMTDPKASMEPPKPKLEVRPEMVEFSDKGIGSYEWKQVSILNIGTAPLQVLQIEPTRMESDFSFESSCQKSAVPPGGNCPVEIRFYPTRPGPQWETLKIRSKGMEDHTLKVTGVAVMRKVANLGFHPEFLNFGSRIIGTLEVQTVEIINQNNAPTSVTSIDFWGDAPQDFKLDGTCDKPVLGPGESCRIRILFLPTAGGSRTAAMRIIETSGGEGVLFLSGEGIASLPEWCCAEGQVLESTKEGCAERKGVLFPNKLRASLACKASVVETSPKLPNRLALTQRPVTGWCCLNGNYFRSTQDACQAKQGFFSFQEEDAKKACAIR